MNRSMRVFLGAALVCVMLAGCNRTPSASQTLVPPADNRFAAIARGKVDVEHGLAHVTSPRDGIVAQVDAKAGDSVHTGDTLFEIDTTQAQIARDAAKADFGAAVAQVQLLRAKLEGTKLRASRSEQAAKAGAGSDQTADDARQALSELAAEIAVAQATAEAAKQKVKQAEYEIAVRTVHAATGGTIVTRNLRVGDAVAPSSQDLFVILPNTAKIVRAELNESFVAKVAPGMTAEVRSEANPDKTFQARVARIGEIFGPSKLTESAQEATDARDVECILELDDSPLRVGERVQVRILNPRR